MAEVVTLAIFRSPIEVLINNLSMNGLLINSVMKL